MTMNRATSKNNLSTSDEVEEVVAGAGTGAAAGDEHGDVVNGTEVGVVSAMAGVEVVGLPHSVHFRDLA